MNYQPERDGKDTDACIRACVECHAMCLKTANYCLERGRAPPQPGVIVMLQVCADLCRVCADTMIRGSDLHGVVCGACAEVCASCATGCEELAGNAQIDECRQSCLRCFDLCSAMAAEMA